MMTVILTNRTLFNDQLPLVNAILRCHCPKCQIQVMSYQSSWFKVGCHEKAKNNLKSYTNMIIIIIRTNEYFEDIK